jgi:Ran GTPase-activating protein (RanGAP) involved in mRNA processing and transport
VEVNLANACKVNHLDMVLKAISERPLKRLNLSGNTLGLEGSKILASFIETSQTLAHLNLDSCSLGDEGLQLIMSAVSANEKVTLEHISLSNNQLTTVQLLGKTLTHLDLSSNPLQKIEDLISSLSETKNLQTLNLRGVCLADVKTVPVSSQLRRLDLSDTQVKD